MAAVRQNETQAPSEIEATASKCLMHTHMLENKLCIYRKYMKLHIQLHGMVGRWDLATSL